MNLLPVADRELRLLARRPRTYISRFLTALIVIVTSVGMLYAGFGGVLSAASAGQTLFLVLSCAAAACVLFDGALLTADCLSSEKREGTIGLLFLTDLKGYDLVAGKLISQTANQAYALLAALPALTIALFLGGVTGHDIVRMTQALLNGLFFAASFGILVSACCREERRALTLAVFGVLAMAGLLPVLGWGVSLWLETGTIHPLFLIGSPAGAFLQALQGGLPGQPFGFSFGESLVCSHLLAWCFLGAASFILPATVREQAVTRGSSNWAAKAWQRLVRGGSRLPSRRGYGQESNPLIQAGDRPGQKGLSMWPVLVMFAVSWAAGWTLTRGQWLTLPIYAVTVVVLHGSLCFFVALHACRGPRDDQRTGVLEILLTTPLGDDAYLTGRMLSLKRQCFWPVLLVLAADFGLMVAGCWDASVPSWEWLGWVAAFAVLAARLLVDLYTVSWVGVWQGLKAGDTGRAIRKTFFYVFVTRWLVFIAFMALLGAITQGRVFQTPVGAIVAAVQFVFMPVMSLQYLCQAMSELRDDLRVLALGYGLSEGSEGWLRVRHWLKWVSEVPPAKSRQALG